MAVFLLKARYGICYVPPPCTVPVFPDVPCSSGFAPWINELVAQGITGGCGGGNYCPANPGQPPADGGVPPEDARGPRLRAAGLHGGDLHGRSVLVEPFAPWIYELVARNITAGCGGGNYCPLTNANRGQMATFLVRTFGLQ